MTAPGDRLFAILWRPGVSWTPDRPVTEQDLGRHRAYFADLSASGIVAAAGPFLDEEGGGLALLKVKDMAEAIQVMQGDPAIEDQVFEGQVRPFYVVFPARDDG